MAESHGFKRLFWLDWRGSLVAVALALVASFFLFGYWNPYWRSADMDFMIVYNAFLLNDGLPQEYFDHPGYLPIVLMSAWFRALHAIGVLDVHALSALPSADNAAAFDLAWTRAVRAGRLLSLGLALIFLATFAALLRRLVHDWRIAFLGTFALAFSAGVVTQARVLRTELLAAALMMTALLILLIAAQTPRSKWRPVLVGVAALLSTLAMQSKVHFFLVICALPVIVLPFGCRPTGADLFWRARGPALAAFLAIALVAVAAAVPAASLVFYGFSADAATIGSLRPAFGAFGAYQAAFTIWVAMGVLAFAALWRVPPLETAATALALIAGFSLGLLALYLRYHPKNVFVVLNPLEQLWMWAAVSAPELAQDQSVAGLRMIKSLLAGVAEVAARRTFFLHTSSRPTIFLEWLVVAMAIIALRRGDRRLALQIAVLMLTVWGIDTAGTLRSLKREYVIVTDPLVVVAAAIGLAKLTDLQQHRWAYAIGVALIAVHIGLSHVEPVKDALRRKGPEEICTWHWHYVPRISRFPFCPETAAPTPSRS